MVLEKQRKRAYKEETSREERIEKHEAVDRRAKVEQVRQDRHDDADEFVAVVRDKVQYLDWALQRNVYVSRVREIG